MMLRFNLKRIMTGGIEEMWKPFINTIPTEAGDPEIEVVYFLWAVIKDGLRNKVKS